MELIALDLEGTGAQDHADEAILEIALVPIIDHQPDITHAYSSLINPGRSVPRRPWISPGLTNDVLSSAPILSDVEPTVARGVNGKYIVGHNVNVDWRLLHLRCPTVQPAGLIDTLRLARAASLRGRKNLSALIQDFELTDQVNRIAPDSQPHRALWDTVAATLLLHVLALRILGPDYATADLLTQGSVPLSSTEKPVDVQAAEEQATLFD